MNRYKCHKEVVAGKILGATLHPGDMVLLEFDPISETNNRYVPLKMLLLRTNATTPTAAISKAKGGYWVIYSGGYESWSPSAEFEGGYSLMESDVEVAPPHFERKK